MFSSLELKFIGGALLVAAVLVALAAFVHHERELGADKERAAVAAATAAQQAKDATETQRRVTAQQEIAHDATLQAVTARADAVSAARARDSLRVQLSAFVANSRAAHPAAAGASAPTSDALDLLSNVLSESDERSGELAAALDASHIAGLACERSYDGLAVK